jgi:hypothetical protein
VIKEVTTAPRSLAFGPPLWLEDEGDAPAAPPRSSRHERGLLRDWLDEMLGDED